jgi:hypothetical protein
MATIALVDPSKTVLIRWSNSCATIAPSARDLRGAQSEQAQQLVTRRLVPYIVRDGQWQCGIRPTAPSMTHPARRVMPNGPVGRKLQHFKCMSRASGAYMPICEVAAEYEPPAPPHMPERCAGELFRGI